MAAREPANEKAAGGMPAALLYRSLMRARMPFDPMARFYLQDIALHQHRQHQLHLHHGETIADAGARTAGKREECVARPARRTFRREALRFERVGIVPE